MGSNVFDTARKEREKRIRQRLSLSAEDDDESFTLFNEFRRSGQFLDIVINVEGKRLSAHRLVLAGRIPYFRGMFSADMMEARQPEVHIYDMEFPTMEILIEFAYTGKLRLTMANVQNIMIGANFLRMEPVMEECGSLLRRRLCPANAIAVFSFTKSLGYFGIREAVLRFIQKHFVLIATTPDFLEIDVDEVVEILERDELYVDGEEQVFEAAMAWIGAEPETRRVLAPRLLRCVRLHLLPPTYLADLLPRHEVLKADLRCRDLVDEAKNYLLLPERRPLMTSLRTRARICSDVPGLIFALGGLINNTQQTSARRSQVEVYDPLTDTWTPSKPMTSVRSRIGVAIDNRRIYALGGFDGTSRLAIAEYFDTIKNEWYTIPALAHRRSAMSTAFLDGRLFVCGGYNGVSSLAAVESWERREDKWTEEPPMAKQRSAAGVAVLDGYLYVLGGHDGMSIFSSCERFSATEKKWETVPNMLTKRCRLCSVAFRGKIYVAGGYDGTQFLSSVECFDPETSTWSPVSPMNIRRCRASMAATNGAIYAIGGFDGLNNLSSCEKFNPATEQWDIIASLRQHAGGVSVGVVPIPADMLEPMPPMEEEAEEAIDSSRRRPVSLDERGFALLLGPGYRPPS